MNVQMVLFPLQEENVSAHVIKMKFQSLMIRTKPNFAFSVLWVYQMIKKLAKPVVLNSLMLILKYALIIVTNTNQLIIRFVLQNVSLLK